jgi:hypothetical protein
VLIFWFLAPLYPEMHIVPDFALGTLFGIGGFCGMYMGAKCQKYVPSIIIKTILCICVLLVAGEYLFDLIK